MTLANAAKGTLIQLGDAASPTEGFTTIAEVTNISGPGIQSEPLDVTHHSSTAGFREYVGGLKDGGEVTLEMNYIPADDTQNSGAGVLKDLVDQTLRNFKLIFPDPSLTEFAFSALVTNFEPAAPVDGKLSASVTLKLSGQPTLA